MSNLSIKDVPDEWAEAIRQRAARNHRSLQGELLAMVEAIVISEAQALHGLHHASAHPPSQRGQRAKTVEQIALELRSRFPQPVLDATRAVDIIRAERDAR